MSENMKKPKIRFKGFTEAWEQCKFGDALKTLPFKQYINIPEQGGKYEIIQQGNEPIVGYANGNPCKDYLNTVIFGDHTLSLYKPKSPFFVATDGVRILQGVKKMNGDYLISLLEKNMVNSEGYKRYYSILADKEVKVLFDSEEQIKIGIFFNDINNLITLHQRKYDKLVNLKKSLLEKMFPKNGNNIPEIRFKGFTEAWEQRKLGEIFNYERPDKYIVKTDDYSDEFSTPVLTANKGFILGYTDEKNTYNENCIIFDDFTLDSKYVDFPFMVKSSAIKILTCKHNYDLRFSYNLLNSTKIEILGHARHYISIVQPTIVNVPKINEQEKVGRLLDIIDNLITLHQRKLEKMKNIKKGLLEKMFI